MHPLVLAAVTRGCPPGSVPGWCDPSNPVRSLSCPPSADAAASAMAHPGACFTQVFGYPAPAPWWDLGHVTAARLGWWIAAALIASAVLGWIQVWFLNRYEVALVRSDRRSPFRPRITRRWYAPGDHVHLRHGGRNPEKPDRFGVLAWDDESTGIPWLLVENLDFAGYADLGPSRPFWAPVTDFTPYTVRRVRPYVEHDGRFPVVRLRDYLPLRRPAGYLEGAR